MFQFPLMPHYLDELMTFQVKHIFLPTLLSMWVSAMLTFLSLCDALGRYRLSTVVQRFLIFPLRDWISDTD